ncbi:MAG: 4-alpha-glucanotransferase [Rikenellaceae bacterium]
MKLKLEIEYRAASNERLHAVGDLDVTLSTDDGVTWCGETRLEPNNTYIYRYELRNEHGVVREESFGAEHRAEWIDGVEELIKSDYWSDERVVKPLRSSLFVDSLFRRKRHRKFDLAKHSSVLECYCERVEPHQYLAVVGSSQGWSIDNALAMSDDSFPYWRVDLSRLEGEYKFVIVDRESGAVEWECGANRVVPRVGGGREIHSVSTPQFDTPLWRGRGVAIPIFSLRTKSSWGVGEFADLRDMVDWSVERGLSVIQVLPINDSIMLGTWMDSYPYNANSTIALHPQYLSMREVGRLKEAAANRRYARRAKRLNELEQIDYVAVMELKNSYLREIYREQGGEIRKRADYQRFVEDNGWWLRPHSLYSYLRDKYSTPDTSRWGRDSIYSEQLCVKYAKELQYYHYIQYHLHCQLTRSVEYARSRGVALKGDIPIGVSRMSCDVWVAPQLFNVGMQAGAPPDPFSQLGQNWGFPTYNWAEMKKDGYDWWRRRFQKMAEYFDAYRIDHILGFFRIWQVAVGGIHGLLGHFAPALPFSEEELKDRGLEFDERFVKPCITDELLTRVFSGEELSRVRNEYLKRGSRGSYQFKIKYDNQLKLQQSGEESLRERLIALHDEVLFIRDSVDPMLLHPRIMGANSYPFELLTVEQQSAFIALHDHFYYHRHNEFWRDSAMEKLPVLIDATNMLVCGEDLGMIPDSVAEVMQRLQILTLEIERMPKAMGVEFGDVTNYPYLSVCTTSTHDMSTIRGWWLECNESTQRYYESVLCGCGDAPVDCDLSVAKSIVDRHLDSPSMLTILPWQDWMAMDGERRRIDPDAERINVPANSRHYWRYRMHRVINE